MNIKKRNKLKKKRILSIRLNISGTEEETKIMRLQKPKAYLCTANR